MADINEPFSGSRQSGISPSRRAPVVFLFMGESGEQYGYKGQARRSIVFYLVPVRTVEDAA